MKVVRSLESWSAAAGPPGRPVLTIGVFDGVHRGHQRLLARLVEAARERGGPATVLTFDPHPVRVLAPDKDLPLIMTPADRLDAFAALGIDVSLVLPFTRALAAKTAATFVREVFHDTLAVRHVVAGPDTRFGRDQGGDLPMLRDLGARLDFTAEAVDPVDVGGERVSSSAIRAKVAAGDVAGAARLLGRWHRLHGEVVPGYRRGRGLGFPTANLDVREQLLPRDGVYAGRVVVAGDGGGGEGGGASGGRVLDAVASVGVKPTFGEEARTVEAHVLDFDGDLYGARLALDLVAYLRPEERYDAVDALVAQMHRDVAAARRALERAR